MFGRCGVWPFGSAGGMKVWGLHDFDLTPEKVPLKSEEAISWVCEPR